MIIDRMNVTSDVTSATLFTRDFSVTVFSAIVHISSAPQSGRRIRRCSIVNWKCAQQVCYKDCNLPGE